MSCIGRRWRRVWTELSLGWSLLNVNLKNLNFLVTLIPTFPSRVGGEGGGIHKTQTETRQDPNWNNMSCLLHFEQLSSLGLLGWSPEVERNFLKMNISFFDDLGGLLSHFGCLSLLGLLGRSPEVECNPKTSISFFDDLGGLFCILVNFCCLDHLANHQKLNVI